MTTRAYVVEAAGTRAVDRDAAMAGLAAIDPVSDLVWVHFDLADGATERWLVEHGDLPPSITRALVAVETRPRFEVLDQGVLLNLRGFEADRRDDTDLLTSIRIWAGKGRIFSVGERDLQAITALEAGFAHGTIVDPGDFIATLAGAITAEIDPDVARLGDGVDDCEERFGAIGGGGVGGGGPGADARALREEVAAARSRAIAYRRFIAPQRQALEALAALDADWLDEGDRLHLKNVADRAARMAEELDSIRDRAALVQEQLNGLRDERIARHGLALSVVSLVFLPLTFITGLLGMNVAGIPAAEHPSAFAVVCAICLAIAVALGAYFALRQWFR